MEIKLPSTEEFVCIDGQTSEFISGNYEAVLGVGKDEVIRLIASEEALKSYDVNNFSDGYHTFKELYDYRLAYNAHLFNMWSMHGTHFVVKSRYHSDGEPCFGGGWFIVVAETPLGQISNHYKEEHWDKFYVPEVPLPPIYDGHTPQQALERLNQLIEDKLIW